MQRTATIYKPLDIYVTYLHYLDMRTTAPTPSRASGDLDHYLLSRVSCSSRRLRSATANSLQVCSRTNLFGPRIRECHTNPEISFSSADNTGLRLPRFLESSVIFGVLILILILNIKKTAIFVKLKGGIFKFSSFTRLPRSHSFQEVYKATLTRPLDPGDDGSWVHDAGTSKVLGQVVAASLKTCVAMIMPGRDFFDDIRRAPDVSLKPQPTSRRGSRTRKFEGILDWWELEPSCCTFPFLVKRVGWCDRSTAQACFEVIGIPRVIIFSF